MCASASTASAGLVGNSVHVSAKNLVDTSILKRSVAIKVPRLDAYPERALKPKLSVRLNAANWWSSSTFDRECLRGIGRPQSVTGACDQPRAWGVETQP